MERVLKKRGVVVGVGRVVVVDEGTEGARTEAGWDEVVGKAEVELQLWENMCE